MPRQKWKKKIALNQFYKLVYVLLDGKLKKEKVLFYRAVRQPQFSTRALVHHKFKKKKIRARGQKRNSHAVSSGRMQIDQKHR